MLGGFIILFSKYVFFLLYYYVFIFNVYLNRATCECHDITRVDIQTSFTKVHILLINLYYYVTYFIQFMNNIK